MVKVVQFSILRVMLMYHADEKDKKCSSSGNKPPHYEGQLFYLIRKFKMGEDYIPVQGSKREKYTHVLQELEFRIDPANHPLSNLSNLTAILKEEFNWFWVGFYFVNGAKLRLGCFQGSPACPNIFKGYGVCGKCWERNDTIIGHIACSSKSRSEIVIPVKNANGQFMGLLDIDSEDLSEFDETDKQYLVKIVEQLQTQDQFKIWNQ